LADEQPGKGGEGRGGSQNGRHDPEGLERGSILSTGKSVMPNRRLVRKPSDQKGRQKKCQEKREVENKAWDILGRRMKKLDFSGVSSETTPKMGGEGVAQTPDRVG